MTPPHGLKGQHRRKATTNGHLPNDPLSLVSCRWSMLRTPDVSETSVSEKDVALNRRRGVRVLRICRFAISLKLVGRSQRTTHPLALPWQIQVHASTRLYN